MTYADRPTMDSSRPSEIGSYRNYPCLGADRWARALRFRLQHLAQNTVICGLPALFGNNLEVFVPSASPKIATAIAGRLFSSIVLKDVLPAADEATRQSYAAVARDHSGNDSSPQTERRGLD